MRELQDIILESGPMGVSKLIDLLQDEREVIRNDVNFLSQKQKNQLSFFIRPFFYYKF
jgi:F420-dependent methylenetetrahydromethanopterin dehydrogenase